MTWMVVVLPQRIFKLKTSYILFFIHLVSSFSAKSDMLSDDTSRVTFSFRASISHLASCNSPSHISSLLTRVSLTTSVPIKSWKSELLTSESMILLVSDMMMIYIGKCKCEIWGLPPSIVFFNFKHEDEIGVIWCKFHVFGDNIRDTYIVISFFCRF